MDGERRWRDYALGRRVWADVIAPTHPSLAEHNPATVQWRDRTIDPDLVGLTPGRARPTRIDIAHGGSRAWTLPIQEVLATPLAWHPNRPLVAGLLVRGRRAHPWVADYRSRTLTVLDRVRASTAFTAQGGTPLAWCADGRLALLVPGPESSPGPEVEMPLARPVTFEAKGPKHVTFFPGTGELKALAAGRVAVLDLGGGEPVPLTGPLLVRGLRPAPSGESLQVEYAEDEGVAVGLGEHDGVAGVREAPAGLRWRTTLVETGAQGSTRPAERDPLTACSVSDALADGPQDIPEPRDPASEPDSYSVPIPGDARLTLFPGDTITPHAAVLWIRAREPEGAGVAVPPVTVTAAGCAVAILDLPVHWPSDATLETLHTTITGTVRAGLDVLTGLFAEHHNGKLIVGGHSFGATLALYALAHVPGFTAAIAHSGCYNRSLTPTGFPHEKRWYWEVPDIYQAFSAVHFADRLAGPVLIIHGTDDINPATPPDQAVGLYRAIVAAGGHARLVLLPHEGHNFHHCESQQSLVAEHRAWLARWTSEPKGC
ncbi:prolyl oligopeptidase family serine peptidase [Streptomyces sp. NPDC094034]|uniref:alpha/beta hydrolase family protein n=1 Tax=Streptomyces sp. NPDC094034 TaxID=3155309 RepID=UPI0033235AA0